MEDITQGLKETVNTDTVVKNWLVNYVGDQHNPEGQAVTVEMIVATMAKEFPEFLMVVAEENWVRGYHQALVDVEEGQVAVEEQASEVTTTVQEDGSQFYCKIGGTPPTREKRAYAFWAHQCVHKRSPAKVF